MKNPSQYYSYFNQPLNNWNVSNVTDTAVMFSFCTEFNQDLSSWNLSNVTHSANMFRGWSQKYNKFNQPGIQGWNINTGTLMFNRMFEYTNMADLAGINAENGTSGNKGSWFTAIP